MRIGDSQFPNLTRCSDISNHHIAVMVPGLDRDREAKETIGVTLSRGRWFL